MKLEDVKTTFATFGFILDEHGVCPLVVLVVGVHGVFCADRLPVSTSVFLAYVYIG